MLQIEAIDTVELGDRSYIAHDGRDAIVIDPQRDIDRILARIDELGLQIALIGETHLHNDYLTGGLALSREVGAPYAVSAVDSVGYERVAVNDSDVLTVGSLSLRVIATPGHTPGHISFYVEGGAGQPALFTGGSLLYGAVGRTDLVDPDQTESLAKHQYRSARRLASDLPGDTAVFPTHGFGSFCAARSPAAKLEPGTLAEEQRRNPALTDDDPDAFVTRLVQGYTPYPSYYAHMGPWNQQGVDAADLSPVPAVDAATVSKLIADGAWVIDVRGRHDFAADHIAGSVNFELAPPFGTYLGWVVPFGAALTLIGADPSQIAAAQRQLVRIGWDRPAGMAVGSLDEIGGSLDRTDYPVVDFGELPADLPSGNVVIDVRRTDERSSGHLRDSVHIPIHSLLDAGTMLPSGRHWVHCASGFRASIAASLLDRLGRDVVLIDDEMGHAHELGLVTH